MSIVGKRVRWDVCAPSGEWRTAYGEVVATSYVILSESDTPDAEASFSGRLHGFKLLVLVLPDDEGDPDGELFEVWADDAFVCGVRASTS